MATRSIIAIQKNDNSFISIYCHWDGYPEGVGANLLLHYNDEEKVKELIALGNISALRERVKPNPSETHSFERSLDDVTIAYGRDRGETGQEPQEHPTQASIRGEEYTYLFKNGAWYYRDDYSDSKRFVKLTKKKAGL